jgi:DNA-binding response OmpR family regulator
MESPASSRAVLVVDDDEAIRNMVRLILEREKLVVDTARDGFEAIEKISRNDYVAIFLDLMMPRVDGFGVIDHLHEERPETLARVVVMSAGGTSYRKKLEAKIRAVLPKPFDIRKLIEYVRSVPESGTV